MVATTCEERESIAHPYAFTSCMCNRIPRAHTLYIHSHISPVAWHQGRTIITSHDASFVRCAKIHILHRSYIVILRATYTACVLPHMYAHAAANLCVFAHLWFQPNDSWTQRKTIFYSAHYNISARWARSYGIVASISHTASYMEQWTLINRKCCAPIPG